MSTIAFDARTSSTSRRTPSAVWSPSTRTKSTFVPRSASCAKAGEEGVRVADVEGDVRQARDLGARLLQIEGVHLARELGDPHRAKSLAGGGALPVPPIRTIGGLATDAKRTPESALEPFSAPVRRWFEDSFEAPTPAQELGWPRIAAGENTIICAPTGSGKTLAAFLWGIDRLARDPERLGSGVRIVYVSPLKALSYDVERNLRAPLRGIGGPEITVGLRTGDTPQRERQAMLRKPPDVLITTPESLVPDDDLAGAGDPRRGRGGDRRRDPRRRGLEARRPPRADAGAAQPSGDERGRGRPAADRPLRDPAPARADRELPRRPGARLRHRRRGHAQGARPRDPRAGRGHGEPRAATPIPTRSTRTSTPAPTRARSGRRSTRSCSSWSSSTPRR